MYRAIRRKIPGLVFVVIAASLALQGQSQELPDSGPPFVTYPEPTAAYLDRLHRKTPAPLAFRADFPGGFDAWQNAAREKLRELLGLDRIAEQCADHQPTLTLSEDSIDEDGYTRQLGKIETEPGISIPFWLLRPADKSATPRPLVICAHGHSGDGWNSYAGVFANDKQRDDTLAKDGNPGVQAVRRGYVALVPATRGLAGALAIPDPKGRHGKRECRAQLIHCLLAGRTPVGERVWDIHRLLDRALVDLEGIDSNKVVLLGNSGGGVLTVHAAALDERIAVAVPSCSFTSFTSREGFIFHCDCCLVPRAQSELGDMTDIGGLIAPRALLGVHGKKDGLHHFADVERAMAHVAEIYRAAGDDAEKNFRHAWGEGGHKFYPELMWPFIEAQLTR